MLYIIFIAWILGHIGVELQLGAIVGPSLIVILFAVALGMYGFAFKSQKYIDYKRKTALGFFTTAVFLLAYLHAQHSLTEQLKYRVLEPKEVRALVYVNQLDQTQTETIQQRLTVFNSDTPQSVYWQLALSKKKFATNPLVLGKYYWVSGKVTPIHGYAVPNAFDQEQWALQQSVVGRLQLTSFEEVDALQLKQHVLYQNFVQKNQSYFQQLQLRITQKRLEYRNFIAKQHWAQQGLMLALLSGDESLISPIVEQQFQALGIQHLLAISGPHILVFAVLLSLLCHGLIILFCPHLYLKFPKPYVLSLPMLVGVLLYSGFVGFEIPALRTLTTVVILTLCLFLRRRIDASLLVLCSASILLLVEPLSVLSAAFWLSYGACLVLIRIYQILQMSKTYGIRQKITQGVYQFFCSQFYIFIALMPITLWFFHQVSWLAFISNIVAIPMIGLLIVPLNIFAACIYWISPSLSIFFFSVVDSLLAVLIFLLSSIQSFGFLPQYYALTVWKVIILALGIMLLLLPKGLISKWYLVVCVVVLLLPNKSTSNFELNVLDVGQGQAIFIRTDERRLLVDTGGHFNEHRFSLARAVLLPFLMKQGVSELDQVILTHLDVDHSGAFDQLQQYLSVKQLISNQRPDFLAAKTPFSYCYAGQIFNTKGLILQVLSPQQSDLENVSDQSANELSCVVYLTYQPEQGQARHILMMGDAGEKTEQHIIQQYPNLPVDVLVLGHHGSKYSSSHEFLQYYRPKLAIASAGYLNRYGHPHLEVQQRLKHLDIPLWVTNQHGTIQLKINGDGVMEYAFYREKKPWLNW